MKYTTLGDTGLEISAIGLGCFSLGSSESWMLSGDDAKELVHYAIDEGINFFDTANSYSNGESEQILGSAIDGYQNKVVVSDKHYFETDSDNKFSGGLSRKAIEQEVDKSLDRLGLDSLDLFSIHRRDYNTPFEQVLRTLSDLMMRGQIRYAGACSMYAHEFASAIYTAKLHGLSSFSTMQNHYNLVYREEEREMLPFCEAHNIGVTPFSPLARGYLTRPHEEMYASTRSQEDEYIVERMEVYHSNGGREINERVEELSNDMGVSMAQVALGWLIQQNTVDAPIVGVSSIDHLRDAIDAVDLNFSQSDLQYLEEPYEPVPITGHGKGWEP